MNFLTVYEGQSSLNKTLLFMKALPMSCQGLLLQLQDVGSEFSNLSFLCMFTTAR